MLSPPSSSVASSSENIVLCVARSIPARSAANSASSSGRSSGPRSVSRTPLTRASCRAPPASVTVAPTRIAS